MSCRGLTVLFAIAAVSAVVVNAVLAVDSNRNVLTVNNNQCQGSFCILTSNFSATGLCVEVGSDSSYIATCNVTTGAFTLKQFLSKDCSGEQFRDITSANTQYTGTQSTFRLPYTHPETSAHENAKLCNNSCSGSCIDVYAAGEYKFDCRKTNLFDKQYLVSGVYGTLNLELVRNVYTSEAECQRRRLPLFLGKATKTENKCASYTPQYNTMCTPVTQTGSSTATATAMLSTATATATIRLPATATATATLPTTTTTTTTQTTTETAAASSTTTATTPTAATPAATAAATPAATAASTSDLNSPIAAARGGDDGGDATDSNSNGVCIWCIVVPIVIVLLLLCIGLLIWLLCCQRREEVKVLDDVEFEAVPNPLHEANGADYYSAQPAHEANGENYYPGHLGQPANGEVAESQQ